MAFITTITKAEKPYDRILVFTAFLVACALAHLVQISYACVSILNAKI